MTEVTLPRDEILKMLGQQMSRLDKRILRIVNRWNQVSVEAFLEKAKKGEIENAEMDAIVMTNLLEERDRLNRLYDSA